jgi:hypothetical protein
MVDHVSSGEIEGFTYPPSVDLGETVRFFVNTRAARFNLYIYRIGYYAGVGARLLQTITDLTGQQQPACQSDYSSGLVSCSAGPPLTA